MENDERGINKLEIHFILEDFSSKSFLAHTKNNFKELAFIKDLSEYYARKAIVEKFHSNVSPHISLSEYKIEGTDASVENIFKVNGQMVVTDIKCISESLRFVCDVDRTDNSILKDITKKEIDFNEVRQISISLSKTVDAEGEIVSSASAELSKIRKEKDLLLRRQEKIINQTLKTYEKMLMEDKVTLLDNRIVLQVDMHQKNSVKGVLHAYSNTKKTAFIEPEELVIFNNQITELEQDEEVEIQRILESLRQKCINSASVEISLKDIIPALDFINSIACYMNEHDARFISIGDSIKLKRCFHPIIKKMKREKAIPIDLELNKNESLMITGPNMGGKTALLKTIGVASLTVKLGLPILADEGSEIALFDRVLADIGDDQSIEDGISTFASHVINYKKFLDEAWENTLVLLDEIGTGTSIKEGSAFAITLIKELINKKAVCVFTSHFDSIKEYALSSSNIKCASMKYDYANNTPYFQIMMDSIGDSGVFNLLKKYGFGEELIESAKSMLNSDYVNYTEIIEKYKSRLHAVEEHEKNLSVREMEINKIENILDYQREQVKLNVETIDTKYAKRKEEQIDVFRKRFEQLVKEIRETGASKNKIKEANEFLKEEARKAQESAKQKIQKPVSVKEGEFNEGDYVVLSSNVEGTIEKINNDSVSVNVNGVIVNTKISSIRGKAHKTLQNELKIAYRDELITNEVDIRGMYPDDAIEAVEKFIMRAQHEGLNEVIIIHGHGTGVLKREVRNYLKRQKDIKSFDSGREMSGGDGVTVVKL